MALKTVLLALCWAVYEWTQTLGWWGVPWGRLPIGQSKYLVGLQTASWFGSYFVTFLIVAVNFCLAYFLCVRWTAEKSTWLPALKKSAIAVAVILVFQYGAGTFLWLTHTPNGEKISSAAIQGNISSHEKWSSDSTFKNGWRQPLLRVF
jgi:apolipoprotein N-acyltransferase